MNTGIRLLIGIILVSASGIAAAHRSSHAFHGSHGFVRAGSTAVVVHSRVFPRVVVRRPFVVAPLYVVPGYAASYYSPPYYADPGYAYGPGYAASAQPVVSDVYYYCPDYRQYYPAVPNCPSPWLKVMP